MHRAGSPASDPGKGIRCVYRSRILDGSFPGNQEGPQAHEDPARAGTSGTTEPPTRCSGWILVPGEISSIPFLSMPRKGCWQAGREAGLETTPRGSLGELARTQGVSWSISALTGRVRSGEASERLSSCPDPTCVPGSPPPNPALAHRKESLGSGRVLTQSESWTPSVRPCGCRGTSAPSSGWRLLALVSCLHARDGGPFQYLTRPETESPSGPARAPQTSRAGLRGDLENPVGSTRRLAARQQDPGTRSSPAESRAVVVHPSHGRWRLPRAFPEAIPVRSSLLAGQPVSFRVQGGAITSSALASPAPPRGTQEPRDGKLQGSSPGSRAGISTGGPRSFTGFHQPWREFQFPWRFPLAGGTPQKPPVGAGPLPGKWPGGRPERETAANPGRESSDQEHLPEGQSCGRLWGNPRSFVG